MSHGPRIPLIAEVGLPDLPKRDLYLRHKVKAVPIVKHSLSARAKGLVSTAFQKNKARSVTAVETKKRKFYCLSRSAWNKIPGKPKRVSLMKKRNVETRIYDKPRNPPVLCLKRNCSAAV